MTDLIIVGAGGYGIEAYDLIEHINRQYRSIFSINKYNVLGFIDDEKSDLESFEINEPVLGKIVDWQPKGKELYVLGISTPKGKEKVAKLLKERGASFEMLIAPTAVIDNGVIFGEGCTIKDMAVVSRGAVIGDFVNVCGAVGGKSKIDDYCTLGAFCNIADASIGKRVFVGSQSVILNGVKVGDDVMVGAGSVVIKNVKSGVTVFGNPARSI